MNYVLAVKAETIARKLTIKDGRGFPAIVFHGKAYEILSNDKQEEHLTVEEIESINNLDDPQEALETMTENSKEFEDLTAEMQEDIMNSGLM